MGRLEFDAEPSAMGWGAFPFMFGVAMVVVEPESQFDAFPMLGLLDLRFDPKPRFLNREFIKPMDYVEH